MRTGVIGCGVVGLTLASKLGLAGNEIHIYSNEPVQLDAIRHEEVDLGGVFDERYRFKHVHNSLSEFLASDLEIVFIAVKTPSLTTLLDDMKAFNFQNVPVMSCQNGIGTEEEIAKRFGREFSWRMVINFAGNVLEHTVVKVQFFHKPNYISCLCDSGQELGLHICEEFSKAGMETKYKTNIQGEIYQKVILNCALSGICALTRMTMENAMNDENVVDIVRQLVLEGMKVAHLEEANLGDDYYKNAMEYLLNGGSHKPSMLVDIENGKPTEIDFLNNQILKLAEKHGVFAPFTKSITTLVSALDRTVRRES
jgi:2-dehydropantoate 2-reductase